MDKNFNTRLREAIEKEGITASELSRISGVSKSDISYYLKGRYAPKQDKCYMLAKALNVDPGWLMTGAEPAKHDYIADINDRLDQIKTIEAQIIAAGVDSMPKEKREKALEIIKMIFSEFSDFPGVGGNKK